MSVLDLLNKPNLKKGLETYAATPGAVLLDARSPEEYRSGHIAGSLNLPLQAWNQAENLIPDKDTPRVRLLPQRCQKQPYGRRAEKAGVFPCDQYWRHRRLRRPAGITENPSFIHSCKTTANPLWVGCCA